MNCVFRTVVVGLLAVGSYSAWARVEVVFLERIRRDGTVVELEPGGRFVHAAVSFQGQWISTHPIRGVELVPLDRLAVFGRVTAKLAKEDEPELEEAIVRKALGKKYDAGFDWSDDEKFYCSEFIAKLFGIEPLPMDFASPPWPESYAKLRGKPGLSPDELYVGLKQKGFRLEGSLVRAH